MMMMTMMMMMASRYLEKVRIGHFNLCFIFLCLNMFGIANTTQDASPIEVICEL